MGSVYFIGRGGVVERRDYQCLFCEGVFSERKALNSHYLEVHAAAFSGEELLMAASRRTHVIQGGGSAYATNG